MRNNPVLENEDSEAESDATDDSQFYHPISSHDLDDTEELGDEQTPVILTNGGNLEYQLNPNPNGLHLHVENGIAALDLNGYGVILASDEEEEVMEREREAILTNGGNLEHQVNPNPNPNCLHLHVESGIAALDLNGYGVVLASDEEDEVMEREREESILRAFREDENRRSAPLPPESAARIMSVMRGVSFPDYTPEWVNRVPEERWRDHLRRLRGESTSQSL